MSLQAALTLFLEQYPAAMSRRFKDDSVADFIRDDVPATIKAVIGEDARYEIHGSPGQGNWARSPWAAIFDVLVTSTAQDGYYVVYLVKEDFTGVYLSLNQGVTSAKEQYGADAKDALRTRAADYLARLGPAAYGLQHGEIE